LPLLAVLLGLFFQASEAAQTSTVTATVRSLFPESEAHAFSSTLPLNHEVRWRLIIPDAPPPHGVLVFVSPRDDADPPKGWDAVLDHRNVVWIAAEGFGNDKPSAQRVLAAIMGLTVAQKTMEIDHSRIYIGGMSGGGRVASTAASTFPQLVTGAMYIVGADFSLPDAGQLRDRFLRNRYVFVTGERDFNRREMRNVYRKYLAVQVREALMLDLADLGHAYPSADRFEQALLYLDLGADAMASSAKSAR